MNDAVFQLKISLEGIRPPIWRRVLIPAAATFRDLHNVIQTAMEWDGSHLHQFTIGSGRGYNTLAIGVPDDQDFYPVLPEKKTRLGEYIGPGGPKVVYTYDFGDDWRHTIKLEKVLPYDDRTEYPACTGGKRKAPPEDCGGIGGYYYLLDRIRNTDDPGNLAELEEIYEDLDFDRFNPEFVFFMPLGSKPAGILDFLRDMDDEDEDNDSSTSEYDDFEDDEDGEFDFDENDDDDEEAFTFAGKYSFDSLSESFTPAKGLDNLSTGDISALTAADPDLYDHIVTYTFETLTREEAEACPHISLLLYLIELYVQNRGRLQVNKEGAYTPKTVTRVFKHLIDTDELPAKKMTEDDIPPLRMLHEFLLDNDYVEEDDQSKWSTLRNPDIWEQPSDGLICGLYRDLFIFLLTDYSLTEITGIVDEENLDFMLFDDSVPFSFYLMKRTNHEIFSGKTLFSQFVDVFPKALPAWAIKQKSANSSSPENIDLFSDRNLTESAVIIFFIYSQSVFLEFAASFGLLEMVAGESLQKTGLDPLQADTAEKTGNIQKSSFFNAILELQYRTTDLFDRIIRWKV